MSKKVGGYFYSEDYPHEGMGAGVGTGHGKRKEWTLEECRLVCGDVEMTRRDWVTGVGVPTEKGLAALGKGGGRGSGEGEGAWVERKFIGARRNGPEDAELAADLGRTVGSIQTHRSSCLRGWDIEGKQKRKDRSGWKR